jgi:uncharacterized protein YgiM (DUF1202 family)
MRRIAIALALAALAALVRCAAPPPPAPAPAPEPPPPASTASTEPASVGTVRVMTATLNVRKEPTTSGDVMAQVKRNDRLALLATRGEWSNVRMADGTTGWVSSKLVANDASSSPAPRRHGGCPADSDFRFTQAPVPSFNDNQAAHGIVTVDANVDTRGVVTSTRIVSNTTGDPSMGTLAEREIRNAKFAPPVRSCAPKAFIFTYKRSF